MPPSIYKDAVFALRTPGTRGLSCFAPRYRVTDYDRQGVELTGTHGSERMTYPQLAKLIEEGYIYVSR